MCWLFPGKTVRVETACLDCNEPIAVEMRDGQLLTVEPPEVIGHLNQPWELGGTVEARAFR